MKFLGLTCLFAMGVYSSIIETTSLNSSVIQTASLNSSII